MGGENKAEETLECHDTLFEAGPETLCGPTFSFGTVVGAFAVECGAEATDGVGAIASVLFLETLIARARNSFALRLLIVHR